MVFGDKIAAWIPFNFFGIAPGNHTHKKRIKASVVKLLFTMVLIKL